MKIVTFLRKTITSQNGLLIFLWKETHSETKSWKSSRILTKKVTTTTVNLEIVEDFACESNFFHFLFFHHFSPFFRFFHFFIFSFFPFFHFFHFFVFFSPYFSFFHLFIFFILRLRYGCHGNVARCLWECRGPFSKTETGSELSSSSLTFQWWWRSPSSRLFPRTRFNCVCGADDRCAQDLEQRPNLAVRQESDSRGSSAPGDRTVGGCAQDRASRQNPAMLTLSVTGCRTTTFFPNSFHTFSDWTLTDISHNYVLGQILMFNLKIPVKFDSLGLSCGRWDFRGSATPP